MRSNQTSDAVGLPDHANHPKSNASTKKLLQTMNFEDDLTQITNKKSLDELGESLRRNR